MTIRIFEEVQASTNLLSIWAYGGSWNQNRPIPRFALQKFCNSLLAHVCPPHPMTSREWLIAVWLCSFKCPVQSCAWLLCDWALRNGSPGEHDKENMLAFTMNHGPCCPIHQSTLDSPDYWTDPALMSSAAPASSTEWRRWEIESRVRHANWPTRHGHWQTTPIHCFHGLMKPYVLLFLYH